MSKAQTAQSCTVSSSHEKSSTGNSTANGVLIKLKDDSKKKVMDEQVSQIQTRFTNEISTIEFYKIQKNNQL